MGSEKESDSTEERPDEEQSEKTDAKKESGGWNKTAITVASSLVVAFLGILSTNFLAAQQREELNHRLYIQLISNREQAESDLRKDMFAKIIESFVGEDKGRIESRLLNLELLAYNFHESLNLKPLFMSLQDDINWGRDHATALTYDSAMAYKDWYRRLVRVASEIKNNQVSILSMPGEKCDFVVPLISPCEDCSDTCGQYFMGPDCFGDNSVVRDRWATRCDFRADSANPTFPRYSYYFSFDSTKVRRKFQVVVGVPPDPTMADLDIRVKIITPTGDATEAGPGRSGDESQTGEDATGDISEAAEESLAMITEEFTVDDSLVEPEGPPEEWWAGADKEKAIPAHFGVGFFDFPLIDNSRLSGDFRYAIILKKIDSSDVDHRRLEMVLLYFPGTYAGLKDKPYYQDMVSQLRNDEESHWWQWW